jgi:uncharacterized protein
MTRGSTWRWVVRGGLLVVLVVAMPGIADRLIFFPTREHDGGTPASIGAGYEDVSLETSDGISIHAWFVPASEEAEGGSSADRHRLVVLFFHGNAGNVSHRLDKLAALHGLGVAVLLVDYRGYGSSAGTPDEPGLYRDADAAYDWVVARGFARDAIVLYGESLGGTVATELAARRDVAGLILESTPSSIVGVARHHYPFVPVGMLLSARFDAVSRIAKVAAPILILHSPDDEIVPFAMAEEMRSAARSPTQLVRLRGGHNDGFLIAGQIYEQALREFLAERRAPARRSSSSS